MKITIVGRQMNVWDEMKILIEDKLTKLDKYFGDECSATATLSSKHNKKCLEITIVSAGTIFRSEVQDETFRNALDRALYSIERQTAVIDHHIKKEDFEEEPEFTVRRKSFTIKPMSVEEAIMQMNLLDHEFFVYKDDSTDEVCVVYKRKDGDYGLISTHE